MNTDKLIFTVIGVVTAIILAAIIGSSIFVSEKQTLSPLELFNGAIQKKGPDNAKLIVVEFSDFECPFCQVASQQMGQLLQKYPNDLQLIYRHFPLVQIHKDSLRASEASEAASKQGKFWEYHDLLFQNQPNFTDQELQQYAKELGLNVDQFNTDRVSQDVRDQVNKDQTLAKTLKLAGTPTFYFIQEGKAEKAQFKSFDDLEKEIAKRIGKEGVPPTPAPNPPVESTPPVTSQDRMQIQVIAQVANTKNVKPTDVKVISAKEMQWPDSSLGCPEQGNSYAQVITPGYQFDVSANGSTYSYHTDQDKTVVECAAK